MKGNVRTAIGLLAAVILIAGGCTRQQEEGAGAQAREDVNWKMASTFAGTLPILGTTGVHYTETLAEISDGRIQVQFFDPGKLVPALEVFDSVSQGSVDAGWSSPGYWIGKEPASPLFAAVPFGPDTSEYLAWMFEGNGIKLWQEVYGEHNLWSYPCSIIPPEASGWFREPITSVDQLKGMKIRFFGLGGKAVQDLGASVQLLAGGDIYPALERGVLDATEFSMPSIDKSYGFHQIAKHYYFPGWHQQSSIIELIVNLDRWNELSPFDQRLIKVACKDSIIRGMTKGEVQQTKALDDIQQAGVTLHTWSDEMLRQFKQASLKVMEEEAEQSENFARVWEDLRQFREQYRQWAKLSRIPEDLK